MAQYSFFTTWISTLCLGQRSVERFFIFFHGLYVFNILCLFSDKILNAFCLGLLNALYQNVSDNLLFYANCIFSLNISYSFMHCVMFLSGGFCLVYVTVMFLNNIGLDISQCLLFQHEP